MSEGDSDFRLEQRLLEKLLAEREELDAQIGFLQKRIGGQFFSPASPKAEVSMTASIQKGEFFGMSRAEAAIALLRKARQPMSTNEIFGRLADSGLDMSGKNVLSSLYTTLMRHPDLRRVARNTWGLKEWYPHLREQPKKKNGGSMFAESEPTDIPEEPDVV